MWKHVVCFQVEPLRFAVPFTPSQDNADTQSSEIESLTQELCSHPLYLGWLRILGRSRRTLIPTPLYRLVSQTRSARVHEI